MLKPLRQVARSERLTDRRLRRPERKWLEATTRAQVGSLERDLLHLAAAGPFGSDQLGALSEPPYSSTNRNAWHGPDRAWPRLAGDR
jgi:hypothetical protein